MTTPTALARETAQKIYAGLPPGYLYKNDLSVDGLTALILSALQRWGAELQAERDRLNGIITGSFPETAALHEILRRAGCVSVRQADYDELQSLRAALAKEQTK